MVAATLRGCANILRYGVVAARRFWWLGAQNAAAALVAVSASLILIPRFGLIGAGAALVAVFAVQLLIVSAALLQALRSKDWRTEPPPSHPSPQSNSSPHPVPHTEAQT